MATFSKKNVVAPDDVRTFPRGKMEVVKLGDLVCGRATFQAGWKWSESVKPIVGTQLCMVHHNGYVISGRMRIRMENGTESDIGPGDVFDLEPGHDAWVLGNEACVMLDFSGAAIYALKQPAREIGEEAPAAP